MELYFSGYIDQLNSFPLPEEEARHLIKVLRHQSGDRIILTDGSGKFFKAIIESISSKQCIVKIEDVLPQPALRNYQLHLAVAPPKNNERFEWFLEKATEIGIDEITPILCRHSERKELKLERMNKILISALKQSWNGKLPQLNSMIEYDKLIASGFTGPRYICTMEAEKKLGDCYLPGENALVMIGPEGDFHATEIEHAIQSGFIPVSLGNSRLRTETAALLVCAILSTINQSTHFVSGK